MSMEVLKSRSAQKVRDWLSAEDGAATLEGVIWVPVYAFFFALIVDTSLMFNGKSQAQRAIQDVNRLASYGYFRSEAEVEDRGAAVLSHLTDAAVVDATVDTTTGVITTTASMPAADLMAIGLIARFTNMQVTVSSAHLIEG